MCDKICSYRIYVGYKNAENVKDATNFVGLGMG